MNMLCNDIDALLGPLHACTETQDGARVTTHCLYPSFDPVNVFVARIGEAYRVHDGGGAERVAWMHGRDEHLIRRLLSRHAARHRIKAVHGVLEGEAPSREWLLSAILAVANASASAASATIEWSVSAAEHDLKDKIYGVLSKAVAASAISREFPFTGLSGKEHRFDFAVRGPRQHLLLIDTVLPHHISISAKYVAFADARLDGGNGIDRFAVYDRPLERDDVSLLQQVADLVPFASLEPGVRRVLAH
jgi:hypothetical protein